jgi:glyoxylase-like metal-dependent hydrolase (beta-lactamase superfamily II)
VTIARYGTRVGRREGVFLNYPLYHEDDADIGMDYYFWVIRGGDTTIVVDTGFSEEGGRNRSRTTLMDPAELYRRIGVDPATSPPVVVTHAHYDHIGNLDLFPTSQVVIAEREYDFWTGPHAGRVQFHHSVEDSELTGLRSVHDEGRTRTFRDRVEVAPGVEVIEVGGHTPGQSVVRVPTADGVVLLASDAVHYYEEIERDMPFSSVAELVRMYEAFDTIRGWVDAGEIDHLVAGHDPDILNRFTPSTEPGLEQLVVTIGRRDTA